MNWDVMGAGLDCRPLPRWTVLPGDPAPLRRELERRQAAEPAAAVPALELVAVGGVQLERAARSCRACGTALEPDGGCFTCATAAARGAAS